MKTIDERKMQKTKEKQTMTETSKGNRSYCKRVRTKWFCCAFKLGYPSGSVPAGIYGTLKMPKFSSSDSFPKRHPIVSSIGTFNCNLVRFYCDLLSPLVPNNYSYKDTFLLFLKLRMEIFPKKILVSYDVTSLFTDIPLQETIDTAINQS